MSRIATIMTTDGVQEIISIASYEGSARPEPARVAKGQTNYSHEQVGDGVRIGMVRGGPRQQIDGWGFSNDSTLGH